MTGEQIRSRAELYYDEDIDDDEAIAVINEAIDKISDLGLIYDTANIDAVTNDAWYPLPDDMTALVAITDGAGRDYYRFHQRGQYIRFEDVDVYTVHYRKHPKGIDSLEEVPPLHVSYHDAIATYLKSWVKLRDDDENPDGIRLMQQFEAEAAKVYSILRRRRGPMSFKVIR